MKNLNILITCALFTVANTASAATWKITDVLQGTDAGFGYSSLHDASGWNPMSGPELDTITAAKGTYNDLTGKTDFTFTLSNGSSFDLKGNLSFDSNGLLSTNSTLDYMGLNLPSSGVSSNGTFGYLPGDVCCGGSYDPNSFLETALGGSNYMTLWGADGFNSSGTGISAYNDSTVGMDFRVELSEVPLPPALWLMFSGFTLLMAKSRKRNRNNA